MKLLQGFLKIMSLVMLSGSFLEGMAPVQPKLEINKDVKVVLRTIENKTPNIVVITQKVPQVPGQPNSKEITSIGANETFKLSKVIQFYPSNRLGMTINDAQLYFKFVDREVPYLELTLLHLNNAINLLFMHFNQVRLGRIGNENIDLTKKGNMFLDVIIDGDDLGKSSVKVEYVPFEVPSLRELSLKAVADKVIGKTMTLEQAKKVLPTDLHEELEEYLKNR